MKGITFIKDTTHNKQFVQIELTRLDELEENWNDLLDVIIAEMRKDDEKIDLEDFKQELRNEGKL